MTTVATLAEGDTSLPMGRSGIASVFRDLALISVLTSTPASAVETMDVRDTGSVQRGIGTSDDEFLPFDAAPRSATVLYQVATRSAALSDWIQDLDRIREGATSSNWDGEGALPVQSSARRYAIALVEELAEGTRLPEVAIDPDGEIALGWHAGNDVFSISISGAGRFSYAGLLGTSDCHGTEWMVDQVPVEIARQLDRFLLAL